MTGAGFVYPLKPRRARRGHRCPAGEGLPLRGYNPHAGFANPAAGFGFRANPAHVSAGQDYVSLSLRGLAGFVLDLYTYTATQPLHGSLSRVTRVGAEDHEPNPAKPRTASEPASDLRKHLRGFVKTKPRKRGLRNPAHPDTPKHGHTRRMRQRLTPTGIRADQQQTLQKPKENMRNITKQMVIYLALTAEDYEDFRELLAGSFLTAPDKHDAEASSLYRQVCNRINRLNRLTVLGNVPDAIINAEKTLIREAAAGLTLAVRAVNA